eukprot:scaffold554468_cov31-Prasinocladus_malaysianus.AAC.1
MSDNVAVEATNLCGPAGQFQRAGSRQPLQQDIGVRLSAVYIYCASIFIPKTPRMDSDVSP